MSNRLEYDIKEKYGYELNEISNKLNQLEAGRVYENGGSKMDGSLATNIKQLRKMIGELLLKIQNGKDGTDDEIAIRGIEVNGNIERSDELVLSSKIINAVVVLIPPAVESGEPPMNIKTQLKILPTKEILSWL